MNLAAPEHRYVQSAAFKIQATAAAVSCVIIIIIITVLLLYKICIAHNFKQSSSQRRWCSTVWIMASRERLGVFLGYV